MNQLQRFDVPFSTSAYGTVDTRLKNRIRIPTDGSWELTGYNCQLVAFNWANAVPTFEDQESFTLNIPTSTGTNAVNCIIPADSTFLIDDLNNLVKYYSKLNNFYLINDDTKEDEYFVEILYSPTAYKVELRFNNVPTSLPAGYTAPAGMTFPAVASWAQLVFPSTSVQLLQTLGYLAGTYPSTTVSGGNEIDFLGNEFPQPQEHDDFLVMLNCVQNDTTQFKNYLAIVNVNVGPGSNILYRPNYPIPVVVNGTWGSLELWVTDVNGNNVKQLNGAWSGVLRFEKI